MQEWAGTEEEGKYAAKRLDEREMAGLELGPARGWRAREMLIR